jgi:predicted O-methyltransferase YrrM
MPQLLTTYLRKLKASGIERKIPNISEENAEFIKNILRERGTIRLLEIGTANGYSTLQFASVLTDPTCEITTIEYAWNAHIEAVEHFKNCKIKHIHAIWGDAKRVIPMLQDEYFDCIYIDAMKREYKEYFRLSLPKITRDGLFIVDDVVKFRDKMEDFYDFLEEEQIPYEIHYTDPDDGIMIIEASTLTLSAKDLHPAGLSV